jgi:hypothetical protein
MKSLQPQAVTQAVYAAWGSRAWEYMNVRKAYSFTL